MLKTIHAILNKDGTYKLAEPVEIHDQQQVLVTLLDDAEADTIAGYPVTMLLSSQSLAEGWLSPEEDEAWKDYQDGAK